MPIFTGSYRPPTPRVSALDDDRPVTWLTDEEVLDQLAEFDAHESKTGAPVACTERHPVPCGDRELGPTEREVAAIVRDVAWKALRIRVTPRFYLKLDGPRDGHGIVWSGYVCGHAPWEVNVQAGRLFWPMLKVALHEVRHAHQWRRAGPVKDDAEFDERERDADAWAAEQVARLKREGI